MAVATLPTGVVTLLFTDIEGSTALLHELGDTYGELLAAHHHLLREVWEAHEGVEVDTEGDAFFVAFASASRAIGAAAAAQAALSAHGWPAGRAVRVRMALHTGEPQVRDGTYWGIDVHYAARLCAAAHGGQVLLSATTRALVVDLDVDDLGQHAVKDFAAPRPLFHLVTGGRRADAFPGPRTLEAARTNLPSVTTALIGREAELEALRERVTAGEHRLLTLIGAGGSGKTRLAIATGSAALDDFADGVFFVALAPVNDSTGVGIALAEAIGAPRHAELGAERAITEHLQRRRLLLIIDNLEHLMDAAPLLARLLAASPGLRMLVTSQAPLRVAAEAIIPLEPLALPGESQHDLEQLGQSPAVALFVDRARAADPSFALTAANAGAVAELCRRLDGLPLALELAAARVRMAGVDGLLSALARGVDALGRGSRDLPERQRGLRAALDWTVSLLDAEQRELFAGLSVFAGAWTLEQAERLFGAELDVWEGMASLLDLSLVHTRGDGRLTMTERVRRHAQEQLAAGDRERELRAAHAELMAELLEYNNVEISLSFSATNASTREAIEEIELAISWTRRHDAGLHRRLLASAGRPLYFANRLPAVAPEIIRLSDEVVAEGAEAGRLMISRAMIECLAGDLARVVGWTGPAVDCLRRHGDAETLVSALATHAHLLTLAGSGPEARAAIAEGLALAEDLPDPRSVHLLEGTIAFAAVAEGAYEEAEARLTAMLTHPERDDFASNAASSYLADCAIGRGDGLRALPLYLNALERLLRVNDEVNVVLQLAGIASALSLLGRDEAGAVIYGAMSARAQRVEIGLDGVFGLTVMGAPLQSLRARAQAADWHQQVQRGATLEIDEVRNLVHDLIAAESATERRPRG